MTTPLDWDDTALAHLRSLLEGIECPCAACALERLIESCVGEVEA